MNDESAKVVSCFCPGCLEVKKAPVGAICSRCGLPLKALNDQTGALSRDFLIGRNSCCGSGCRNCPYPMGQIAKKKTCPACGKQFDCGGNSCWCANVSLAPERSAILKKKYSDCLCPACINAS